MYELVALTVKRKRTLLACNHNNLLYKSTKSSLCIGLRLYDIVFSRTYVQDFQEPGVASLSDGVYVAVVARYDRCEQIGRLQALVYLYFEDVLRGNEYCEERTCHELLNV